MVNGSVTSYKALSAVLRPAACVLIPSRAWSTPLRSHMCCGIRAATESWVGFALICAALLAFATSQTASGLDTMLNAADCQINGTSNGRALNITSVTDFPASFVMISTATLGLNSGFLFLIAVGGAIALMTQRVQALLSAGCLAYIGGVTTAAGACWQLIHFCVGIFFLILGAIAFGISSDIALPGNATCSDEPFHSSDPSCVCYDNFMHVVGPTMVGTPAYSGAFLVLGSVSAFVVGCALRSSAHEVMKGRLGGTQQLLVVEEQTPGQAGACVHPIGQPVVYTQPIGQPVPAIASPNIQVAVPIGSMSTAVAVAPAPSSSGKI